MRRKKLLSERITLECTAPAAITLQCTAIYAASLIVKDWGRKVVKATVTVRGRPHDSLDASASMNAKELGRLTMAA